MTEAGTRRAAVVALYGAVPRTALGDAVAHLQAWCRSRWGTRFQPRPLDTLHTTLIGLDAAAPLPREAEIEGLLRSGVVDVRGLLRDLADDLGGGLHLQYGGFTDLNTALTSRGLPLTERSVVLHRDQLVLIGWPVVDGVPDDRLDVLRRRWERHGVRHRYPLSGGATDPDAHMVVGELAGGADPDDLATLRGIVGHTACRVTVTPELVDIVVYDDPHLPRATSRAVPMRDLIPPAQGSRGAIPSSRKA